MKSLSCLLHVVLVTLFGGLCQCSSLPSDVQSKTSDLGEIKGLVIVNNTALDIDDVRLTVANNPRQINVNRVLPMSEFATEFPAKRYRGNAARLTWNQAGKAHSSSNITFSIPSETYQNQPVTVYLNILANGKVVGQIK